VSTRQPIEKIDSSYGERSLVLIQSRVQSGHMTQILRYSAFTTRPEGGNPAGVVLDARGLDDEQMQKIATSVGYSETAFARPVNGKSQRFAVRYFSPRAEVAFCGHATIATAVAIAEQQGHGELVFDTPAGSIGVVTARCQDGYRATLRSVPTHSRPATPSDVAKALQTLHWSADDLDPDFPPHVAFAGNEHLVLAARTRHRLAQLDYDFEDLRDLMTLKGWTTLQLFWRQNDEIFHSRNPFPIGGVVEDPATGAAAAALGGYLRALGHVTAQRTMSIIQGEDMGRPSQLAVTVDPHDPQVSVAGAAVKIGGDTISRRHSE